MVERDPRLDALKLSPVEANEGQTLEQAVNTEAAAALYAAQTFDGIDDLPSYDAVRDELWRISKKPWESAPASAD